MPTPSAWCSVPETHAGDLTALAGLPTRRLGPLDPASAHTVLDEAVPGALDPRVSARMIDETGGNPLAMLELVGELTAEQLAGRFPLPRRLPVGRRVDEHFLAQVAALVPAGAHRSARSPRPRRTTSPRPCGEPRALLGVAAEAADRCRAHRASSRSSRESHSVIPLIRSAVYDGATPEERRRVHAALATVADRDGDDDQAAWHRAAAVTTPEETIAADLEASATAGPAPGRLHDAGRVLDPGRRAVTRHPAAVRCAIWPPQRPIWPRVTGRWPRRCWIWRRQDSTTPACTSRCNACARQSRCSSPGTKTLRPSCSTRRAKVEAADVFLVRQILFDAMQAAVVARQYTAGTTLEEVAHAVLGVSRDPRSAHPAATTCCWTVSRPASPGGYADAVPLLARRGRDDVHRRRGRTRRHPVDDSGLVRRRRRVGREGPSRDVRTRPSH